MLETKIREKFLVDELQLGDSLNLAIHNNNREYFNLLLSMVSNDVTDDAAVVDPKKINPTNEDLRKEFHLPPKRDGFYVENRDFVRAIVISGLCGDDDAHRAALNLTLSMEHEPLAYSENASLNEVLKNVSPLTKEKTLLLNEEGKIIHNQFDLRTLEIVDVIDKSRALGF